MSSDRKNPPQPPESILAGVDGPSDLTSLTDEHLQQLAQEVREHIIDTVGEIGGHFGANLGTCELAVALHSLLDSPRDKILWDVGHQAYPHKVLTGRRDGLERSANTAAWRRSARSRSQSTTSWAPVTPPRRLVTRWGSRRGCAKAGRTARSWR